MKCFAGDVFFDPLDAAAGHRVEAGFDQRHPPVVLHGVASGFPRCFVAQVDGEVRLRQVVIEEKRLMAQLL